MAIKVGINGFGRIGRMVFRAAVQDFPDIEVVGINDLLEPEYLAYMLRHDSVHGKFKGEISVSGTTLIVNGKKIRLTAVKDPAELKWNEIGAEIVIEATGLFLDKASASKHLAAGAKKVIMSAPSKDDTPMFVFGVNDKSYAGQDIISNASCTTNCLAPLVKPLHEKIGLVSGLMTTVHAYTNDQVLTDVYHKDLRRARSATMSMIPTKTGAAAAVGLVLPDLNGKLDGLAVRVPTINVSLVDLTFRASRATTRQEVVEILKTAAAGELKGVLAVNELPLVSIDFNHDPHSSIFEASETKVIDGTLVKVMSWYDNEWGFSNRMLDTARALIHAKG